MCWWAVMAEVTDFYLGFSSGVWRTKPTEGCEVLIKALHLTSPADLVSKCVAEEEEEGRRGRRRESERVREMLTDS